MGLGVGLGVGLCLELGLKELRPKVEEANVLGVGMVRAIGLAPNTYPVPEALPLTTPSLSRWRCSYVRCVTGTPSILAKLACLARYRGDIGEI